MAGDDGDDWISLYKRAIGATPTKIDGARRRSLTRGSTNTDVTAIDT